MIKPYWQFIFGLQYNAEQFFKDQINYYDISHPWSAQSCDTFLVRDFQNNNLLYDSIDHLIIDLAEQQFRHCSLYPLKVIFPNHTLIKNHFFEFVNNDYPVAVFKKKSNKAFALIQIEREKVSKVIHPIGDPRDFWAPSSSQSQTPTFGLFTLIELNQHQKNECYIFDQNLSWNYFIDNIHQDLIKSDFSSSIGIDFEYTNNLYYNLYNKDELPLISKHILPNHLGFSLIQMLEPIENRIKSFTHHRNENSDYRFFSAEQLGLFEKFRIQKEQLLIQLICFTANHIQSSMEIADLQKQQLHQWEKKLTHISEAQNNFEKEQNAEQITTDQPITAIRAFISITVFLIVLFSILYGFYWLTLKFEFVKFSAITIGIISFLYIWSKK